MATTPTKHALSFPLSAFAGPDSGTARGIAAGSPRRSVVALAAASLLALTNSGALAQAAEAPGAAPAQTITITGRSGAASTASVAGFGDIPLARSPFSATVIGLDQLQDAGIASLGDITRLDAGLTDAYNAPGYWGQLAARGFTLDNRFNFRRDGLPINAETALATANKAALELFKGTSGIQAGTSSPGGLLNLVVKRPTARPLRTGSIEWTEPGTATLALDLADRAGPDGAFGWRLNAAGSRLDPSTRDSRGSSHLLAGAAEWRVGAGGLVEVELERSRQSQPSVPGFSLLGDALPSAKSIDPRLNLNNQPWSLPVVFEGDVGSVRLSQSLGESTQLSAHLMQQSLRTDDRIAFPFGCFTEDDFTRFCSDGSFDLYDFRSENERRRTRAADIALQGSHVVAGQRHQWSVGVLRSDYRARFERQAYNYVGAGTIDGLAVLPPDPALTDDNTQRDERSTEFRLQDVVDLGERWQLWAGARHTRLSRDSIRTDGTRQTAYSQSFTTPWAALAWQPWQGLTAYVSAGQGVESEVAPNRPRYTNAGQALPALKSRQFELGLKHRSEGLQWQWALFDIQRPAWSDIRVSTGLPAGSCSNANPCARQPDGSARHRGIEADAEWQQGPLSLRASALLLQARREGAADPTANGLRPTNVPAHSVKLQAAYNVATVPGLAILGFVSQEGARKVLPDNSASTDGWTRLDLGLRYAHQAGGASWVWRAGVDNVADARAWKESPYQFGHAYLYPLAPRTWRVALNVTL
jgi:iron complex outermembrane recepter protein